MDDPMQPTAHPPDPAATLAHEFVAFAVESGALRFGEWKTKAGRLSPYFFNAGAFDDGAKLGRLVEFYARRLLLAAGDEGLEVDLLFGPAYKGIPLVAALAVELARRGLNLPYAFNRKEAKDHGEGGTLVGAKVAGRVVVVDDVISAGTSVRESIALIDAAGGRATAVALALDRQERGTGADGREVAWSAVQYVRHELGLRVTAIATLDDLLKYLQGASDKDLAVHYGRVDEYRGRYGVDGG